MTVLKYLYTLKYLTARQIFFQVVRRVYKPRLIKHYEVTKLRPLESLPIFLDKRDCFFSPDTFVFLEEKGRLSGVGWQGSHKSRLWRYNQHYFDYLNSGNAAGSDEAHHALLLDWLKCNPPGDGVGWEPYPLSLRIVNWIKWDLKTGALPDSCRESLVLQGLALEKNLEYHILGNHLFANAKALAFLGCYLEGELADRWLKRACDIILTELDVQVLPDGGNYELSPMYHCIFCEDVLDLIGVFRSFDLVVTQRAVVALERVAPKMIDWMKSMTFADGGVACFNDSATNVAAAPEQLHNYGSMLHLQGGKRGTFGGLHYEHLAHSGYIVLTKEHLKLILDVAKLGPDYLLAHGHADSLSFECAIGSQRVFVNSGTSRYEYNDRRHFERSTKAHNTVEVDNKNSSDVWSSFRVARRAYPSDLSIIEGQENISVTCSHTGYQRWWGGAVHTRKWELTGDKLLIDDEVSGPHEAAVSRFILHSSVALVETEQGSFVLTTPQDSKLIFRVLKGIVKIVPWKHTTEFGVLHDTHCIEIELQDGQCAVEMY